MFFCKLGSDGPFLINASIILCQALTFLSEASIAILSVRIANHFSSLITSTTLSIPCASTYNAANKLIASAILPLHSLYYFVVYIRIPNSNHDNLQIVCPLPPSHSTKNLSGSSRYSFTLLKKRAPSAPSTTRWSNVSDSGSILRATMLPARTTARSSILPMPRIATSG